MLRAWGRLLIGGVLLATALGKSLDVVGFSEVVGTYRVLPTWAWLPTAVLITGIEWVLGLWLWSGRRLAHAAAGATGLHLAFSGWAALALLRGVHVPNCGCFGVFLARPLTWGTVLEDLLMVTACALLWRASRATEPQHHLATA